MAPKTRAIASILVIACAVPILAHAQGAPGYSPLFPGGPLGGPPPPPSAPTLPPPFLAALRAADLTPTQQNQMRMIMDSGRQQSDAEMRQLHSIHQQIADKLLGTAPVSEADLAPLAQQATLVDQQVQQQWLKTALRVRALLTPDQLTRMNAFHHQVTAINAQIEALMAHGPIKVIPDR